MNRKIFMKQVAVGSGLIGFAPLLSIAQSVSANKKIPVDPLIPEKVKEFVAAGHNDFEKTKRMHQESPSLIYASWDCGGGDFETALEGAGHVGDKGIANYLIEAGARTNLFVLTMLGKTAIVKSYLETYPSYLHARGPHGLTLLHHAIKGGDDAKEILEYLQSKGLKETKMKL